MQMNNIKKDDEDNLPLEDDIKPDIIFDIDDVESENAHAITHKISQSLLRNQNALII